MPEEGQYTVPGTPDPSIVAFETAAKTAESEDAGQRNLGREATEAALLAQRDDLAMIGIGCTAKQHGEKVWFIHPEGRFRKVWDFCQSFLLLYVAIMVPLRMGFDMEAEIGDGDWWVELFVDMYFISDIVFNFRTGVYDSDGVLITDRAKIRRKYLRGWFGIDIVSCFPAGYIAQMAAALSSDPETSNDNIKNLKAIRILRLLRLAKMLRLGRLKRIFARYAEELQPFMKAVKLTGMFVFAGFLCHILCCVWWAIGDVPDVLPNGDIVEGWIKSFGGADGGNWGVNVTHPDPYGSPNRASDDPGDYFDVRRIPLVEAYLVSFYWAVTTLTTIGYGDISPVTSLERFVGIFAMAIGGFLFGMLVGTLSSHITAGNIADQEYRKNIDTAREFLRMKDVPTETRRRIMAFLDNLYTQNTAFDEEAILSQLPEHMQHEMYHIMYHKITEHIPFFANLDEESKAAVCTRMKPVMATSGEQIAKEGEVGSDMYIVVRGQIMVMRAGVEAAETLKEGAVFGEETVFSLGGGERGDLRVETYVAKSAVELRCLTRTDMTVLIERFPELGQDLAAYVLAREEAKDPETSLDSAEERERRLRKLEELASTTTPAAFRKAFKGTARRRSVPNISAPLGPGGSPKGQKRRPTGSHDDDEIEEVEEVLPRPDELRRLASAQQETTLRLEQIERQLQSVVEMLQAKAESV